MLSLHRDQSISPLYIETDNLAFSYTGNHLKKITDSKDASTGFIDYVNEDVEYTFNANGAMATDRNKGLNMTYDPYNGMPKKITVSNTNTNGSNSYVYTATGQKLKVTYTWSDPLILTPLSGLTSFSLNLGGQISLGETKTVDYAANKIYEDGALKRILIDNGYIENGIYYFYVRDHLGNNRIVADVGGNVIQKTDYYPFGMPTSASTAVDAQPYKYNGKEYDMMNGLNQYDYHARQYDPAIIRFNTPDPLAEKYYSISPYVYCNNNPMKFIDPSGMDYAEYEYDDALGEWVRISDIGDEEGVDFYYYKGWDNLGYVTDRQRYLNSVKDAQDTFKNGEIRGDDIDYDKIKSDFFDGTGPFNMQAQMMGSYNISFYRLGSRILTLGQDSKSKSSWYYHLTPSYENYERGYQPYNPWAGTWQPVTKMTNTYQNYLFWAK